MVTNTNDAGPGSLRQAALDANSAVGADTIAFDATLSGATITLAGAEIAFTEEVDVDATSLNDNVTIDANDQSRIFNIYSLTGDYRFAGLTLTGGLTTGSGASGGAINSSTFDHLTIEQSTLVDNRTTGGSANGGAVFAHGDLTLTQSTVSQNSTGASGGGIFGHRDVAVTESVIADNGGRGISNDGDVTVAGSVVSGNVGGIFSRGDVLLADTTVSDNHRLAAGGGVSVRGDLTMLRSELIGNSGGGSGSNAGGGGAIVFGATTITESIISENTATAGYGGGIFCNDITLTDSEVNGNQLEDTGGGGGIHADGDVTLLRSTVVGNSSAGDAGGIEAHLGASVFLTDSLVSGNTSINSGGGIRADGDVTVINSTVAGNSTPSRGGGIHGEGQVSLMESTVSGNESGDVGAGVDAHFGSVTMFQSTVSGNSSGASGGGIWAEGTVQIDLSTVANNSASLDGGGIWTASPSLSIAGSIVATNLATGAGSDINAAAGVQTLAYSLVGDNNGTGLTESQTPDANGNLIGSDAGSGIIDPLLGLLGDNGGNTETHALLQGSPAIDAGDPTAIAGQSGVPTYDQRGNSFDRVVSGRIDIGAFESQQLPPSCDFDGDLDCDGADIDALQANIVAGPADPATFDLTGDGLVNLSDRDQWLALAGALNLPSGNAFLLGDANLDGTVDGQDFVMWNANKFTSTSAWTAGDFSANGTVDGEDFVIWNTHKFMSADESFSSKPTACLELEEIGDASRLRFQNCLTSLGEPGT